MNLPATELTPIVITQYEKLRTDISILTEENEKVSFNYRDPKQNKLARSHVFKLRTAKGEIDRARVTAKAYALDYGRKVDAAAKDLEKQVEALIAPHQKEIDAIEAEETARKAKHQAIVDRIVSVRDVTGKLAVEIAETLAKVKAYDTSGLQEYKPQADAEILATIKALDAALIEATKREAEAAELIRLRAETAAREEADRVAEIQRKAVEAERVRVEGIERKRVADEAAAKAVAEQKALAEREAKDRAARDAIAAVEKAKADAELAAARELARVKAEAQRDKDERAAADEAKREGERMASENKKRVAKVHADILEFVGARNPEQIVEALAKGEFPYVTISYR